MEESADALAGVEGALTGSNKRKGTTPSPSKKKGGATTTTATATAATTTAATTTAEVEASKRPRSKSMEQLAEVAGSILKEEEDLDQEEKRGGGAAWYETNDVAIAAAAAAAASAAAAKSPPEPPDSDRDGKSRKTQITYNPDITMTKEQLTAWRREMRRVRNRESAAASRRKVRDRIDELEDEVEIWKIRYQEVMARLGQTEGEKEEEEREIRRDASDAAAAVGDAKGHSHI